jgi:hypothetical protein
MPVELPLPLRGIAALGIAALYEPAIRLMPFAKHELDGYLIR